MTAWLRRNRLGLLLGGGLVLTLLLLALVVGGHQRGALDPDGYDPAGAHALSVLLQDRGVRVERTTDVPSTLAAAPGATVFVPEPQLLSEEELRALAHPPGDLVVAMAGPRTLELLGQPAELADVADEKDRDPGCRLPAAVNAGRALSGGPTYRTQDPQAQSCYGDSIVTVPARRLTLLGDPTLLTNERLDRQGNAALAIGLLGTANRLVWLMPAPDRAAFGSAPVSTPDQLLPEWVRSARRGLFLAAAVLVLWRVRRLGRVVLEQLPVVVRAAETVEGHGRLYHAAGARGTAAGALRRGALRTLARLSHGGEPPTPEALTALVAERAGRDGASVHHLLYGPAPADDAALVRLADELDALTRDALAR
jgi:hypothetical protein